MKTMFPVLIGVCILSFCAVSAVISERSSLDYVTLATFPKEQASGVTDAPKNFDVIVGVTNVLKVYRVFTELELAIDSRVASAPHADTYSFTIRNKPREQIVKEMEKSLLEHAGIVIKRLDERGASVTYNDALPISPTKDGGGR